MSDDPTEIVVHEVVRYGLTMIFHLLREGVGQAEASGKALG